MKVQNVIAVIAGVAGAWTYFAGVEQWKPSQMDEVFSIWLNCGAMGGENVRFK